MSTDSSDSCRPDVTTCFVARGPKSAGTSDRRVQQLSAAQSSLTGNTGEVESTQEGYEAIVGNLFRVWTGTAVLVITAESKTDDMTADQYLQVGDICLDTEYSSVNT